METPLQPNDMEHANEKKRPGRPRGSGREDPELRVVAINVNPAPDAQDRLRRLFTLLLEHAAKERQAAPEDPAPPDEHAEEDA